MDVELAGVPGELAPLPPPSGPSPSPSVLPLMPAKDPVVCPDKFPAVPAKISGSLDSPASPPGPTLLGMTRYQWLVMFAAWLGWGFDLFDAYLFNYVASNCVPSLLGIPLGTPEAASETTRWTGILSSIMLAAWAFGGCTLGIVTDWLGRSKALLLTMILYSVGTAACAGAPNMGVFVLFKVLSSIGLGGEWAAGSTLVAEVVPVKHRVAAGVLLYTAAPIGLIIGAVVNYAVAASLSGSPDTSWRFVFLVGLLPAAVAFVVRLGVREPDAWVLANRADQQLPPSGDGEPPKKSCGQRFCTALRQGVLELRRYRVLFRPDLRRATFSGISMPLIALLAWWSISSFVPSLASDLAAHEAAATNLNLNDTELLKERWKFYASLWFNLGSLIGAILNGPVAVWLGRRAMYFIYLLSAGVTVMASFGPPTMEPRLRLALLFPVGFCITGIFASFPYYLPELFPMEVRATGSGLCYNLGRFAAAGGPFLVGSITAAGYDALLRAMFWIGVIPLVGAFIAPFVLETKYVCSLTLEEVHEVSAQSGGLPLDIDPEQVARTPSPAPYPTPPATPPPGQQLLLA